MPARRKPPDLIYGVDDEVPLPTCILLGLQHTFQVTTAIAFALIVIHGFSGTDEEAAFFVSMSLLAGGIATILQVLNRRGIGSGYFAPAVCEPAYITASLLAAKMGGLPLVFGMTALSGLFEIAMSRVVQRLRFIFTPEVTGLVVAMVGVSIIPVAVPNFLGLKEGHSAIDPTVLLVSLITFGTMVGITIWSGGKTKLYSVLIGMIVGYVASYLFGLLGPEQVQRVLNAPLVALPNFSVLRWSFDLSLIIPFAISSLCASVKTLGNITTCQKINDLDWKRPEMQSIRQGLLSDGMGMSLSGLLGGMGQSSASSNIGLSLATGATSSKIAFSTGGILIALAFLPRIAEMFVIMPQPVMGATPIFAMCFIVIIGLQMMMSRMMDSRKIFILGISLIFGLSVMGLVNVYSQIPNTLVRPIFSSTLYLATLLAIALTFLFRLGLARKVQLLLEPKKSTSDDIFSFMEIQGAAWGARREVIYKAISALNEIAETVTLLNLAEEKIVVDVRFDEFNLNLSVQYHGKPFPLQDLSQSDPDFTDEGSLSRLSVDLIRKLADKVTSDCKDGVCRVMLHFEH